MRLPSTHWCCDGILWLFTIQLSLFANTADAVRCFECSSYISPTLCTYVTKCAQNQICYVEEKITDGGRVVFDSGCMERDRCPTVSDVFGRRSFPKHSSDITVCMQCCQDELCNIQGCDKKVLPRDKRGPFCYTCDFMNTLDDCDRVQLCSANQQCALYVPRESLTHHTTFYTTACVETLACEALQKVNIYGSCPATCCKDDYCNTDCGIIVPTIPLTAPNNLSTSSLGSTSTDSIVNLTTIVVSSTPSTRKSTIVPLTKDSSAYLSSTLTSSSSTTTARTTAFTIVSGTHDCGTDGFIKLPDMCIKVYGGPAEWNIARTKCNKEAMDLVVLDSTQKIHELKNYLRGQRDDGYYWIGLHDEKKTDVFKWVDGQFLTNTHSDWALNEPDSSSKDCVYVNSNIDYEWSGKRCTGRFGYICERK